jgi:mersacidin/lichenicidin family type 2 lantibiotic
MSRQDIIRAWKDAEYRSGLTAADCAQLPDHPAGVIELTDAELDTATGGTGLEDRTDTCGLFRDCICPNQP